jgi:hypothetical protein
MHELAAAQGFANVIPSQPPHRALVLAGENARPVQTSPPKVEEKAHRSTRRFQVVDDLSQFVSRQFMAEGLAHIGFEVKW